MKNKFINWIIWILLAVSIVSALYIWRFQSNSGLDLGIEAANEMILGAPYDVKVNFTNNTGSVLENAVLTLILPDGAAFFGSDSSKTIDNKSLGNVGAGSLVQESYKIILSAIENPKRELKAKIAYSPAALSARFEKTENFEVGAGSSGVVVEMATPEKIVSGEEFELAVSYRNVSEEDFSGLELKIEYPPSFSFSSASLKPDRENNTWVLGDLHKNSEGKFTIKGNTIGAEGDSFDFKSFLSLTAGGESYVVNQNSISAKIASSPLALAVRLDAGNDYAVKLGDNLNYTVSYINNSGQPLKNIVVRAQLIGEMFAADSINTSGSFRPADKMIIWNSANTPQLASLPSGSAGAVSFSIKVKDGYQVKRFSDKNFSLQILASGEATGDAKIISKAKAENKLKGNLIVETKGFFRDADSGILNRGPLPPKVGQSTNFTIHWILRSYASDMTGVEVSAALGNNVKMVGEAKSNSGSVPYFDSGSNKMIWKVDRVQANQGVLGDPIEAVFQVEAIPSASQVATYMIIVGDTFVKAVDGFSGAEILNNDIAVTSALPDDVSVSGQGGVVQP